MSRHQSRVPKTPRCFSGFSCFALFESMFLRLFPFRRLCRTAEDVGSMVLKIERKSSSDENDILQTVHVPGTSSQQIQATSQASQKKSHLLSLFFVSDNSPGSAKALAPKPQGPPDISGALAAAPAPTEARWPSHGDRFVRYVVFLGLKKVSETFQSYQKLQDAISKYIKITTMFITPEGTHFLVLLRCSLLVVQKVL